MKLKIELNKIAEIAALYVDYFTYKTNPGKQYLANGFRMKNPDPADDDIRIAYAPLYRPVTDEKHLCEDLRKILVEAPEAEEFVKREYSNRPVTFHSYERSLWIKAANSICPRDIEFVNIPGTKLYGFFKKN